MIFIPSTLKRLHHVSAFKSVDHISFVLECVFETFLLSQVYKLMSSVSVIDTARLKYFSCMNDLQ